MEHPFGLYFPRNLWGGWTVTLVKPKSSVKDYELVDALRNQFGNALQADVTADIGLTNADETIFVLKIELDWSEANIDAAFKAVLPDKSLVKNIQKERHEAPFQDVPSLTLEQLENYFVNLNRIPIDLRLSTERFKLAFNNINMYTEYDVQPNVSRFDLWETNQPDLQSQPVSIHPYKGAGSPAPKSLLKEWNNGIPIKMSPLEGSCGGVFALEPRFGKAFPEELFPLYALLKDSTDIRSRDARGVASQLGIFESPNNIDVGVGNFGLKEAATYGARFRLRFTLGDAIGSQACPLEASRRVTNGVPLDCPLFLLVRTVNCVQTH
jgi:hypothetical protein